MGQWSSLGERQGIRWQKESIPRPEQGQNLSGDPPEEGYPQFPREKGYRDITIENMQLYYTVDKHFKNNLLVKYRQFVPKNTLTLLNK